VGSLAVCTSKDSSIDGPGYLSALVVEAKYVDEVSAHDRWVAGAGALVPALVLVHVCMGRSATCITECVASPPPAASCCHGWLQSGLLVTLTQSKNPSELAEFICSYGESLSCACQHANVLLQQASTQRPDTAPAKKWQWQHAACRELPCAVMNAAVTVPWTSSRLTVCRGSLPQA
jgi:hypothetical protein